MGDKGWFAGLHRDGVAVIPQVFSLAEVNHMRSAAMMALTQIKGGKNRLQVCRAAGYESPGLLLWPAISNAVLNKYRTDPRLVGIVRSVLGENIKQINNQVYFRLPGDRDSFSWHQDKVFRQPAEDFPGVESGYLQTVIVIDEITEDNAPVEYITGSHRAPFAGNPDERSPRLRQFSRDGLSGVKIMARPGDVMVWSVMVVHGSDQNRSQLPRMTYMNGFARADCSRYNPPYLVNSQIVPNVDQGAFK
jgi:ectoine hydroxylase-related dioxygenase (phytanoyl-CoA dioxygenase family)